MQRLLALAITFALLTQAAIPTFAEEPVAQDPVAETKAPALAFEMETLDGKPVNLAEKYADKVVLLVNVASKCGYTRQYAGLQALNEKYADQGLAVVGVPCNQFGGQEPGTAEEIATFCSTKFGVDFDLLEKVEVNGDGQAPLYAYLTKKSPYPGPIKWNFEKFLVSRDGKVVGRYASKVEPDDLDFVADIEHELAKK